VARIEKSVFLSYRRTNVSWALAIYQYLSEHGYDVFFDYKSIGSGDFDRIIVENIKARAHFVVLLTPSALEPRSDHINYFRREIETALDNKRNIVPVMIENFDFSEPKIACQLTGRIAALTQYSALSVPAEYFQAAMERLCKDFLSVPLKAVLHPPSRVAQEAVIAQQVAAKSAPPVHLEDLSAEDWYERGESAQNLREKLANYGEAIRLKPDYGAAYNNRGYTRKELGDTRGAMSDFDNGIRVDPSVIALYINRAALRKTLGDLDGALEDCENALRLSPRNGPAYVVRAAVHEAQKAFDDAFEDCNAAIRESPDLAAAYVMRGALYESRQDIKHALQDFDKAVALDPLNANTRCRRAMLRVQKGDKGGVLEDAEAAIQHDPMCGPAYSLRGFIRIAKGEAEQGMKDIDEGVRLSPNDPSTYQLRAMARTGIGDQDGAAADIKHFIEMEKLQGRK
jgi:tetratricopeptide (TPR) repeat protein